MLGMVQTWIILFTNGTYTEVRMKLEDIGRTYPDHTISSLTNLGDGI